jgi:hypothetical protein
MTKDQARKIIMDSAVEPYGTIYDDRYKKIAKQAFLDGMVFWDMVKAGVVSEDMIDEDFFLMLRESNG